MSRFRRFSDVFFKISVGIVTVLAIFPLFHIILTISSNGLKVLEKDPIRFLTAALSEGGIGPAIFGTLVLIGLSALISVPVALLSGIFMYENVRHRLGIWTKTLLQMMMEIPTILVGISVMGTIVLLMGRYSAIAGAVALAIVTIPYVAISTSEALKSIPFTYVEAAYSLGLKKPAVILRILFPMAHKGILTGIMIGLARAAGETAPLLFTIGGLYEMYPRSLTQPIGAIPLLIYNMVQSPSPRDHEIAWGSAFVLMVIFFSIFLPIKLSMKEVKL